jgi:hypothetical protein
LTKQVIIFQPILFFKTILTSGLAMNISEILLYLPTFLAASTLIVLATIAIVILPWRSKDFHQGQKEFRYVYDIIKTFLKEDMAGFLAQYSTKDMTRMAGATGVASVTRVTKVAEDITGIRRRRRVV